MQGSFWATFSSSSIESMDIRTLRLFVEIAKQGSFADAAKTVFTTQSTVSKAIKNLEEELGMRLVERSGRAKGLTQAGQLLYQRAVNVLGEMSSLEAELAQIQGLQRGHLRIGFPKMGTSAFYAGLFAKFRQRYPDIEVHISVEPLQRLEDQLRQGDIDLAALLTPQPGDFEWQHVRTESLIAMVPKTFVCAQATQISLEALARWPFMLFEDGSTLNETILRACALRGVQAQVDLVSTGQVDFLTELVASQLGVGLLPRVLTQWRQHPDVRYLEVQELHGIWQFTLAWRRGAHLSHPARAWLDLAQEHFMPPAPVPAT